MALREFNWKSHYDNRGYYFPIRVFDDARAASLRDAFLKYIEERSDELKALPPREHYCVLSETHTFLPWVYSIASHPAVLDAISEILGPNVLIWSSRWFSKMPGDKTYVSWHQDATYWGMNPLKVTTAWIALSDSIPENGCLRVVPETHKQAFLPQIETYAPDNALTRGQEIAVQVEEQRAVDVALHPGEMSLHHVLIVHGSKPNTSDKPRIGIAVRYVAPEVKQQGDRPLAILVCGKDEYGNFELVDPPSSDAATAMQSEAVKRVMKNILR